MERKKKSTAIKFEANPRKINTIPSIPGHGQSFGYKQTNGKKKANVLFKNFKTAILS